MGIPPESQHGVFDMFSQLDRNIIHSQGGMGIGLSLVKNLVEMHEGTVSVFSAGQGLGSTFTIRLPCVASDADEHGVRQPVNGANANNGQHGRKVLVVDDNTDAANTLSMVLEMIGHVTAVAENGRQAIQVASHSAPKSLSWTSACQE
ncbi:ATP-binding protein [Polaromonas sp.]|uniref:hybrid sensor histidine kinase/response regulator n=1 Tax=Polaromonas sp. TaxID=1869339 RepID=UPI00345CEDE5